MFQAHGVHLRQNFGGIYIYISGPLFSTIGWIFWLIIHSKWTGPEPMFDLFFLRVLERSSPDHVITNGDGPDVRPN